jgi:hypothetical protein
MVEGAVPVILLGILGGIIAELIKIGTALKSGTTPTGPELIASGIFALLGAGAVLYGTGSKSMIEVAQVGAAFPLLFSAGAAALTQNPNNARAGRTLVDYISFRM